MKKGLLFLLVVCCSFSCNNNEIDVIQQNLENKINQIFDEQTSPLYISKYEKRGMEFESTEYYQYNDSILQKLGDAEDSFSEYLRNQIKKELDIVASKYTYVTYTVRVRSVQRLETAIGVRDETVEMDYTFNDRYGFLYLSNLSFLDEDNHNVKVQFPSGFSQTDRSLINVKNIWGLKIH